MNPMKSLATLALFVAAAGTAAQSPAPPKTAYAAPNRAETCEKQAGARAGDERKAFLQRCLKPATAATAQQTKMKQCNVDAKGKKGDERREFMRQCLRKK